MMPWDDIQSYMTKQAQDASSSALTFLKMMYNAGYAIVLTEFGRQITEDEKTIDLENGRRAYQVPSDVNWPKTLELIDGTNVTPLVEVTSDHKWAYMKTGNISGQPECYHYKPRFGVGGGVIEVYPAPAGNNYDMRMTYEVRDKNLSQDAYTAGTIALLAGNSTVTGTSTTFTDAMVGRYLIPTTAGTDSLPYKVINRASNTVITLENNYAGANASGANYKIVEIPNLPDDMHLIPAYFSLEQWWSSQGNAAKQKEFQGKWTVGMARAKKTHSAVTRDVFMPNASDVNSPFPGPPVYFPATITE